MDVVNNIDMVKEVPTFLLITCIKFKRANQQKKRQEEANEHGSRKWQMYISIICIKVWQVAKLQKKLSQMKVGWPV